MNEENTAGTPNRFIVMREWVLRDKNLSSTDKIVYARMCSFDIYFESAEECAEFLGMSERQVREARRKLEKYGYIKCVVNDGRGKKYKIIFDNVNDEKMYARHTEKVLQENGCTEKCISDVQKNDIGHTEKCIHRIKGDKNIKESNIVLTKVNTIGDSPKTENTNSVCKIEENSLEKEYGNPEINYLFDLWESIFLFKQKSVAKNRRAAYNFTKAKNYSRENFTKILQLLKASQYDRFAPKQVREIVDFSSLQKNFPHLMMWANRQSALVRKGNNIDL